MTKLLDKAFARAARLDPQQQDELARWLLARIAAEEREDAALVRAIDEGMTSSLVSREEVMARLQGGS
ncbi:MAG TPA: hypothetical protein PKJ21_10620 [Anaerolineae bacterium]|nr:hypothetical protein [Anaerolineae bacterium]HNT06615.1 hypothetical protein [Anaerolineae bacterium]